MMELVIHFLQDDKFNRESTADIYPAISAPPGRIFARGRSGVFMLKVILRSSSIPAILCESLASASKQLSQPRNSDSYLFRLFNHKPPGEKPINLEQYCKHRRHGEMIEATQEILRSDF
jgi:hypothetical protein